MHYIFKFTVLLKILIYLVSRKAFLKPEKLSVAGQEMGSLLFGRNVMYVAAFEV